MEATEAIEYLAAGIKPRGLGCLAGVIAALADKSGYSLKSMRLTFREGLVQGAEFKFPRLSEEEKPP